MIGKFLSKSPIREPERWGLSSAFRAWIFWLVLAICLAYGFFGADGARAAGMAVLGLLAVGVYLLRRAQLSDDRTQPFYDEESDYLPSPVDTALEAMATTVIAAASEDGAPVGKLGTAPNAPTRLANWGCPQFPGDGCRIIVLAGLFLTTTGFQAPNLDSGPQPAPTPELRAMVEEAEKYGRLLYVRDKLGARATDLLVAKGGSAMEGLAGYLILEGRVIFIGGLEGARRILHEVSFSADGSEELVTHDPPLALPAVHDSAFAAKLSAADALPMRCAETYNADVMLADESDPTAGWRVYLLAATTKPGMVHIGGHARIQVSADGSEVLKAEKLSLNCLDVDLSEAKGPPQALMASRLGSTPSEADVYVSLLHELPLFVVTSTRDTWMVLGGYIGYVDRVPESAEAEGE